MTSTPETMQFAVGSAQIHLQNVRLRLHAAMNEIHVDEIHLESGDIKLASSGDEVMLRAAETKFQVMISEPHINALLEASIPADAPVRTLRVALFSGKIRVTGHVVKSVLHLPFTLDAVPLIENGVTVKLDCQAAKLGIVTGVGMPAVVVELIEQYINNNPALPLDLSRLPVPVRLDEIQCQPGRLNIVGRAKLQWPLAVVPPAIAPFSPRETPTYLLPNTPAPTLLPGEQAPEAAIPSLPSA